MCRVLSYLGQPLLLDVLLYESDNSLVRQVHDPQMFYELNLAGFGFAAWDQNSARPERPILYHSTTLPMFDRNLKSLSENLTADCIIGHIRATDFIGEGDALVAEPNLHPFKQSGLAITLAHNGGLARFWEMKFDLLEFMDSTIARRIEGTTDTEWIYALFVSQLDDPTRRARPGELETALERTIAILRKVRARHGIAVASPLNLFVSDGERLVVTRITLDYGCYDGVIDRFHFLYQTLWYTLGSDFGQHDGCWKMVGGLEDASSILVASEPLSRDISSWIEMQEYSMLSAWRENGRLRMTTQDLDA